MSLNKLAEEDKEDVRRKEDTNSVKETGRLVEKEEVERKKTFTLVPRGSF